MVEKSILVHALAIEIPGFEEAYMIKISNISELNINDSILVKTIVLIDSVEMILDYIENYDDQSSSTRKLVFKHCAKVEFKINPGYDSQNSLLDAKESPCEEGRCIRIETNTTAGIIEITCADVFLSESITEA